MNTFASHRSRCRRTLLALLAVLLPLAGTATAQTKVGTSAAAFLGLGVGARATAMGGAQVATVDGPSALYWNPAAVAGMDHSGVEFSYADWFIDASLQYAGAVLDLGDAGHLGLSVTAFDYGEIEVTTIDEPEGTGERFSPLSLAVGVSYAKALTDRFSIGGTVKVIRESIQQMDATGAAVDLGVLYHTGFRGLRLGMTLTNFGTSMRMSGADLRLPVDIDPDNAGNIDELPGYLETDDWPLPLAFTVGAAMDAFSSADQRLTLSVDALAPYDDAQSANLGAEYAFRDLFFVRGGYRQAFTEHDASSGWSAGAGLRYDVNDRLSITADYVIQWFKASAFDPPQMFSLGVGF